MINKKTPVKRKSVVKVETEQEEVQKNIETIIEDSSSEQIVEITIENIELESQISIDETQEVLLQDDFVTNDEKIKKMKEKEKKDKAKSKAKKEKDKKKDKAKAKAKKASQKKKENAKKQKAKAKVKKAEKKKKAKAKKKKNSKKK